MDQEDDKIFLLNNLQTCSYRYLQGLAKSMHLPSNVKKMYLIQLIHAQKYNPEAVDSIMEQVRLERHHQVQMRKHFSGPKKTRLQGTEISSTSNGPTISTQITEAPNPGDLLCTSTIQAILKYNQDIVRTYPSIKQSISGVSSDRILRSSTSKTPKPNYAALNDSLYMLIKDPVDLDRTTKAIANKSPKTTTKDKYNTISEKSVNISQPILISRPSILGGFNSSIYLKRSEAHRQLMRKSELRKQSSQNNSRTLIKPHIINKNYKPQVIDEVDGNKEIELCNKITQTIHTQIIKKNPAPKVYEKKKVNLNDSIKRDVMQKSLQETIIERQKTKNRLAIQSKPEHLLKTFLLSASQGIYYVDSQYTKTLCKSYPYYQVPETFQYEEHRQTYQRKYTQESLLSKQIKDCRETEEQRQIQEQRQSEDHRQTQRLKEHRQIKEYKETEQTQENKQTKKHGSSQGNKQTQVSRQTQKFQDRSEILEHREAQMHKPIQENKQTQEHRETEPQKHRQTQSDAMQHRQSYPTSTDQQMTASLKDYSNSDVLEIATTIPKKRRRTLSGIYPLHSPENHQNNVDITPNYTEKTSPHNDGKVSKITLMQKQIYHTNYSYNTLSNGKHTDVTIQDIIDSNVDAQTHNLNNVYDSMNYPNMSMLTDIVSNTQNSVQAEPIHNNVYYHKNKQTTYTNNNEEYSYEDPAEFTSSNKEYSYKDTAEYTKSYDYSYPKYTAHSTNNNKEYLYENTEYTNNNSEEYSYNNTTEFANNNEEYSYNKVKQPDVYGPKVVVERLPKINDAFSQFNHVPMENLQPIYVEVSAEEERIFNYPVFMAKPKGLEHLYNLRKEYMVPSEPILQIGTTNNTTCVFSTRLRCTPVVRPSTLPMDAYTVSSYEQDSAMYPNAIEEPREANYSYVESYVQPVPVVNNRDLNTSLSSHGTPRSRELNSAVTIPEMVEDALEIISQDGDYMERIGMDVRMQCILCNWAGPQIVLDQHIRQEHASSIEISSNPWHVSCSMRQLARPTWHSHVTSQPATTRYDKPRQVCDKSRYAYDNSRQIYDKSPQQYDNSRRKYDNSRFRYDMSRQSPDTSDETLYVLSALCTQSQLKATLTTLSSDQSTLKSGSITMYNKVTGEPYTWEGLIQPLPPNIPYENDLEGLSIDLSKLNLLPNSANLKLVNGELVSESSGKVVFGQPNLNDIHVIFFVHFF